MMRLRLQTAARSALGSAVAWAWALNLLRLGSGVFLLPLLLTRLSGPDLGMYYVFSRLLAIAPILDFGFSFSFSRSVGYAMGGAGEIRAHGLAPEAAGGEPNHALLWRLQHCARTLYTLLAFGLLLLLSFWGTWTISQTVGETSTPSLTWTAWGVACLGASVELYLGWWNGFLRSCNKVLAAAQYAVIGTAITLALATLLLWNGGGLLSLPIANLAGGLVSRSLSRRACLRLLKPDSRPDHFDDRHLLARIWPNSWRVGLQLLAVYGGTTLPGLHYAATQGLAAFAPYGLSYQLMSICTGMAAVWVSVKWPMVSRYRAQHDNNALRTLLWPRYWLQIFTFVLLAACAIGLSPLLLGWTGSGKSVLAAAPFLLLALASLLDSQFSFWTMLVGTENRIPSLWPTVASQCAALALYLGLSRAGVASHWALILPPLLIGSVFNYWYWCFVGARSIGTSFPRFLLRSFAR